ncbi:MAG: alpha/beta fold hydrolase [Myxococcales bacterium FL481]|nr:MAG: alpha/beta fold hydrolase [Myxococcales bacterium FL481]
MTGTEYWHRYYDEETLAFCERFRQSAEIQSTGVRIHLDVYANPNAQAPVVIVNHGGAGYSRMLITGAMLLHQRGYTVVLPDQRGQGLSGGNRGDYTIEESAQNIADACRWAKSKFQNDVFLVGASVGGGLAYYAAAAGAPAAAVACLNLFDFGNGIDGFEISRMPWLLRFPRICHIARAALSRLDRVHRVQIPFHWIGAFDHLMDERDAQFQSYWQSDPIPPRWVSLRLLTSNLNTAPAIAFEDNRIPVLVINQARDKMVAPAVTHRNYERLGAPKRYVEIPFGHWSNQIEFWEMVVNNCDDWFREVLSRRDLEAASNPDTSLAEPKPG